MPHEKGMGCNSYKDVPPDCRVQQFADVLDGVAALA